MNKFATRRSNIFDPESKTPFALSRSKIDLFMKCPRCFYLDRRLGVSPPRGFPFNLNEAVDILYKKEFDLYREKQEVHPLVKEAGLELVPFQHEELDTWRNPFKGIRFLHKESNFEVFGGIDDIWKDSSDDVYIVDYKATSKDAEVSLDAPWQRTYKAQIEIYQWLFKNNGFSVSDTGYFVYTNGDRSKEAFKDILEFRTKLIPYVGKTEWIDGVLVDARKLLESDDIPKPGQMCENCAYRTAAGNSFKEHLTN